MKLLWGPLIVFIIFVIGCAVLCIGAIFAYLPRLLAVIMRRYDVDRGEFDAQDNEEASFFLHTFATLFTAVFIYLFSDGKEDLAMMVVGIIAGIFWTLGIIFNIVSLLI